MESVLIGSSQLLHKFYFICLFLKRVLADIVLVTFHSFFKLQLLEFSPRKTGTPGRGALALPAVTADLLLLLLLLSFQRTAGHMMTSRPRWRDDVDKSI